MNDDLRRAMDAEVGGGSPPDLAEVWSTGRRRRTVRRRAAAGGAVTALLVVTGLGLQLARSDGTQIVETAGGAGRCNPPAVAIDGSGGGFTSGSQSALLVQPPQPPRTLGAMVRGGGSEHLAEPDLVARVRVESIDQLAPEPPKDESFVNRAGEAPSPPIGERRIRVVVTDPVFGTSKGKRFTISDLGTERLQVASQAWMRAAQEDIARLQAEVDAAAQPLADLDEQILSIDPGDPRYQALVGTREALEKEIDGTLIPLQNRLSEAKQQVQLLEINERLMGRPVAGTPCHRFEVGDDLIVALTYQHGTGRYELTGSSSYFLVDGDGFSDELDAARRSVDGWSDSPLLALARRSTPEEFLDHLRQAAAN